MSDQQHPDPCRTGGQAQVTLALRAADIVGVWDGDLVAGMVYGDANFARIYGVDAGVATQGVPLGSYFKFIHPDDLPAVRAALEKLYAGAPDYSNEHRVVLADGAIHWVLTRGRMIRNAAGHPTRFAGVSVDITERKRSEDRQAFLLTLTDHLLSGETSRAIVAHAVTLLGKYLGASRVGYGKVQADQLTIIMETGYADGVEPLQGPFPLTYFGEQRLARHREGLTNVCRDLAAEQPADPAAFAGSAIRSFVSVPLLRDGRFRACLFASFRDPHRWDAEEVALIESVAARLWDALERTRAEDALRQLNASLESQVAARTQERERNWRLAPVLMVIGGPDGSLLEVNPAWTRILGWSAEETIGRDVMDFVAPEDRETGTTGMQQLFNGSAVIEYQNTFVTKAGGRRRISWTTVPEAGRLYGFGRDVTDQVLAEESLRQAQKMEAVGQLTGGLAHDFNNLLAGITGCLELLQSRLNEGRTQEMQRYVSAAHGAARRAAALTHRLLAFSRRQTLDPKPTNVNELVAGMAELIRRTVGPELHIDVKLNDTLWTTLVDPHQLENALLNLSLNARDAMPHGGDVLVETANFDLDAAMARERDVDPGQYVTLRVTDSGSGMTSEVLRRAFDPFFTTKPLGSGTGLGLSMIYGFTRQSGGHVRITSKVGKGTSVCIFLPRYLGSGKGGDHVQVGSPIARAASRKTVLVVDDEPTVRLLVAEVLGDLGYDPIEAADGAQALDVLQSAAQIDLLISDVGLPGGLNGRQLADAGRLLRPSLRVLFITGYAEDALVGHAGLGPGMHVLTKPFTLETLATRIKELTAQPEHTGPESLPTV